jgi:phosphoribosylaminoimidazolecarboxamide formyltransferase / IMP cyclohydrolase
MKSVRRALISVHDKTGVVDLARGLQQLGVEILSTGGTARLLREAGVAVVDVAEVTGFPEMLDGRVKTLHPKIHGGILARREAPEHMAALDRHGISPIDLVVVTLYPFAETVARDTGREDAIENIDIGGPAMIRGAAKNHEAVAVVTEPLQYQGLLDELRGTGGTLSITTRARLAAEAFRRTADYDTAIADYLAGTLPGVESGAGAVGAGRLPERMHLAASRVTVLKYGENPHQAAALYRLAGESAQGLTASLQLCGPELSFNNLLDGSAALALLLEFDEPAAVVIKHTNPCGVAVGASVADAMRRAKASDPVSIYGGIVAMNRTVDMEVVKELVGILLEMLLAPAYEQDALEELRRTKKKCRVLRAPTARRDDATAMEMRSVLGGLLVQEADGIDLDPSQLTVVSTRPPVDTEMRALRFAWRVAKHAKSNAIVLTTAEQVIGVGAGQMNRVDAARLAVMRARELGLETRGTVCASDAFFPFRDGLDVVARAGATAAIHPGGSVRDEEVIAAANEHGMALVMTGIRHFKH